MPLMDENNPETPLLPPEDENPFTPMLTEDERGGEDDNEELVEDVVLVTPTEGDNDDNHEDNHRRRRQRLYLNSEILTLCLSPIIDDQGSPKAVVFGLSGLCLIGILFGLAMPSSTSDFTGWYRVVSNCIGYTYFTCWSVSFYPQVVQNYQRQTTHGLSADFCGLNVIGFACYATYNLCFYYSVTIQHMYKERYGPTAEITVQSNDVAFAVHAFVLASITLIQIAYYDGLVVNSKFIQKVMMAIGACAFGYPILVFLLPSVCNWLNYLYLLSYMKIVISFLKYVPQVVLNYQRQSTVGWSIWQILLDFSGGLLSVLQLVFDCMAYHDWSGITGNLAKFCLGFVSIAFDCIFMTQHYILYNPKRNRRQNLSSSSEAEEQVNMIQDNEEQRNQSNQTESENNNRV